MNESPYAAWLNVPKGCATGCLPRISKPGGICSLAGERFKTIYEVEDWDAELAKRPNGEINLLDLIEEPYDQNGAGSCAKESPVHGMEIVGRGTGMKTPRLNPWFSYGIATNWRGGPRVGTNIDANLVRLRDVGCASEAVWPRSMGYKKRPSEEAYADALLYRYDEVYDCTRLAHAGTSLLDGFPVVVGWSGHSELLVGLKPGGIGIVLNSYGAKWGPFGNGTHLVPLTRIDWQYGAWAPRTLKDTGGVPAPR